MVTLPGMHTDHTLLNVVRSRGPGRIRDAVVIDNLETKPNSIISKGIVGQVKKSSKALNCIKTTCDLTKKNFGSGRRQEKLLP